MNRVRPAGDLMSTLFAGGVQSAQDYATAVLNATVIPALTQQLQSQIVPGLSNYVQHEVLPGVESSPAVQARVGAAVGAAALQDLKPFIFIAGTSVAVIFIARMIDAVNRLALKREACS